MKYLSALVMTAVMAMFAMPANAVLIASFSQNPSATPTVLATDNGTQTSITIDSASTFVSAGDFNGSVFFSFNADSIDAAVDLGGFAVLQHYAGNFCFTSVAGCAGTNFLSGTFSDAAFGGLGGPGLVVNANNPPDTLTLNSDVIPSNELQPPSTFNITFADLTPALHIDGSTIAAFTADFAGDISASTVNTPEPGTMAILGTALIGLGVVGFRKRSGDVAQT